MALPPRLPMATHRPRRTPRRPRRIRRRRTRSPNHRRPPRPRHDPPHIPPRTPIRPLHQMVRNRLRTTQVRLYPRPTPPKHPPSPNLARTRPSLRPRLSSHRKTPKQIKPHRTSTNNPKTVPQPPLHRHRTPHPVRPSPPKQNPRPHPPQPPPHRLDRPNLRQHRHSRIRDPQPLLLTTNIRNSCRRWSQINLRPLTQNLPQNRFQSLRPNPISPQLRMQPVPSHHPRFKLPR